MKASGVDLIIINYRTPDDLDACLGSLVRHPPEREHNVVVVNVAPLDADSRVASRWWYEYNGDLQVRSFSGNVGYNRAANEAATWGKREIVAVFNADVEFTAGVIDAVCDELLAHDDWAIAGPRLVDHRDRIVGAGTFITGGRPRHRGWHDLAAPGRYEDIRDDCCTVMGAAYFVKRDVWNELTACPFYRETFPGSNGPMSECRHYYGDELCAVHATQHGYKLGYVGTATMLHKHMGAGKPPTEWTAEDRRTFERFRDMHPEVAHA